MSVARRIPDIFVKTATATGTRHPGDLIRKARSPSLLVRRDANTLEVRYEGPAIAQDDPS
jgi:hypothetical protein